MAKLTWENRSCQQLCHMFIALVFSSSRTVAMFRGVVCLFKLPILFICRSPNSFYQNAEHSATPQTVVEPDRFSESILHQKQLAQFTFLPRPLSNQSTLQRNLQRRGTSNVYLVSACMRYSFSTQAHIWAQYPKNKCQVSK